ncbi:hypothetical protein ACI7MO_09365 [Bacillus paranthracis]|uniref:hypothetical protein n=1 Tax=Bacillus paranthracis TaxID=2026186 RepID=UPI00397A7268
MENTWFDYLKADFTERTEKFCPFLMELIEEEVIDFDFSRAEQLPVIYLTVDTDESIDRFILAKYDENKNEFFYEISRAEGIRFVVFFTETELLMKHIHDLTHEILEGYGIIEENTEEFPVHPAFAAIVSEIEHSPFKKGNIFDLKSRDPFDFK